MRVILLFGYVLRRFPIHFLLTFLAMVFMGILEAAALVSLAPTVDLVLHPDLEGVSSITKTFLQGVRKFGLPVTVLTLMSIFLGFNLLKSGCHIVAQYCVIRTNNAFYRRLLLESFADVFGAKWQMFVSSSQGTLLNTFVRQVTESGLALEETGLTAAEVFLLAFCLLVPFYISWKVTVIALAFGLALAVPFFVLGSLNYRLGRKLTEKSKEMDTIVREALASARIILGFGNQKQTLDMLRPAVDGYCKARLKSMSLQHGIPVLFVPCGIFAVVVAFVAAQKFGIALSETAVQLYALMKCVPYVGRIAQRKSRLDALYPSFEQVQLVTRQARSMRQESGSRIFQGLNDGIDLNSVSFAFPGRSPALTDINIRIPKGKMIGIVGESGAGKSTLIDMIMGFHEPSGGEILVDGVPLFDLDIVSYRKCVGYVPQDAVLFDMTIRENLLWAKPSASEQELRDACAKAHASEFIDALPQGYDTAIGDRGVRLSGGQCQRLALARAILRKPDLLILDEATSSLDTHSERLIQQAMDSMAKETTLIVVAHRLSTIANSDVIYVLDKGRVAEEGSYNELLAINGRFSRMVEMQLLSATN